MRGGGRRQGQMGSAGLERGRVQRRRRRRRLPPYARGRGWEVRTYTGEPMPRPPSTRDRGTYAESPLPMADHCWNSGPSPCTWISTGARTSPGSTWTHGGRVGCCPRRCGCWRRKAQPSHSICGSSSQWRQIGEPTRMFLFTSWYVHPAASQLSHQPPVFAPQVRHIARIRQGRSSSGTSAKR